MNSTRIGFKANCLLIILLIWLGAATSHAQSTSTMPTMSPALQNQLFQQFESKVGDSKERLDSLHRLYKWRGSLSMNDRGDFLRKATAVAQDKTSDANLRADSIWVVGGLGMEFKHEKMMTHEEVAQKCQFLLQTAADESEDARVRRISITTLGNLKMKEGVPVVKSLLANKANHHRPDIARPACIALAELAPEEALTSLGEVLSGTTNSAIFGTAAYALGRIKNRDVLPVLMANRQRLCDNLSVDNAVEAMSNIVTETLKDPSNPQIIPAIKAVRSLWREEQKAAWRPLLKAILAVQANPIDVRQEALHQLQDESLHVRFEVAQNQLAELLPLIEKEAVFSEEVAAIRQILSAQVLPPAKAEEAK